MDSKPPNVYITQIVLVTGGGRIEGTHQSVDSSKLLKVTNAAHDRTRLDLLPGAVSRAVRPFVSLDEERKIVRDNIQRYRWDLSVADTEWFRDAIFNPLARVLNHSLSDPHFLKPDELILFSLVLMESSWLLPRPEKVNKLGQQTFELGKKFCNGSVHPVAVHLQKHNQIKDRSWNALWGLRSTPIPRKNSVVADAQHRRVNEALDPLYEASDELPGWGESLKGMRDYQIADFIVSRLYHPNIGNDATARRFLEMLRDSALNDSDSWKHLLRAELAVAVVLGQVSSNTIRLLSRFLQYFATSDNTDNHQTADILRLNMYAESNGNEGDSRALDRILALPKRQRELLLKRDMTLLLPSARDLLWKRSNFFMSEDRISLATTLEVPGDEA